MIEIKRKRRLFAFSSIDCHQAGPPHQTLRAPWDWPLSAFEKLESRQGCLRFSAFSDANSKTQNRMPFMSPRPSLQFNSKSASLASPAAWILSP